MMMITRSIGSLSVGVRLVSVASSAQTGPVVLETRIDDGGGRSTHLLGGHAGGGEGRGTP
jgi:hypothetical protein